MNYCKQIEERVKQFTDVEVRVKVLQKHPTYTLATKLRSDATGVDPQSLIKRAIPQTHPFSDITSENGWLTHSFYLTGRIPTTHVPTNYEIWGLVLHLKRKTPALKVGDKTIADWDFEDLEQIVSKHLTGTKFNTVEDQEDYLRTEIDSEDADKYGGYWKALSNYWQEFTAKYKTWQEIYTALEKDSEYIRQWQIDYENYWLSTCQLL